MTAWIRNRAILPVLAFAVCGSRVASFVVTSPSRLVGKSNAFLAESDAPVVYFGSTWRGGQPPTSRMSRRCKANMLDELRSLQHEEGRFVGDVIFDDDQERSGEDFKDCVCTGILVSGFGEDVPAAVRAEAVDRAIDSGTLLVDKSHWGIIRVQGEDRLRFLHNHGTNAFEGTSKGSVVPTCFTTNQGRVIDFVEAVVLEDEVRVLCSPQRWERALARMDKFMFPLDRTTVSSLSDETAVFSLAGPGAAGILSTMGCEKLPAPGRANEWEFSGEKVIVMCHSRPVTKGNGAAITPEGSLSARGMSERRGEGAKDGICAEYTMLLPSSVAMSMWSVLSGQSSLVVAGEREWQYLRVKQGLPSPGNELTVKYNPLEAGLWHAVHFDKGCYVGQETISRVNAYKNVNLALYGIEFEQGSSGEVSRGEGLLVDGTQDRAGVVTSLMDPEMSPRCRGLAYIRAQAGGTGLKVMTKLSGIRGTVVDVPYPSRSEAESACPPSLEKRLEGEEDTAELSRLEDERAKEKARKAAKVAALEKKLEALKARKSKGS